MDKSWMETNRISKSYVDGVAAFTDYAVHNLQKTGNIDPRVNKKHIYIPCPCTKCLNHIEHKVEEVQYHLYRHGIDISYTKWTKHGEEDEPSISAPKPVNATTEFVDDTDFASDIPTDGPATVEMVNATKDNFDEDDLVKFQELLLDAEKPLYEGCPDFTKLSAIVKLLNLKGKYGASDKFFTELLGLIKKMLPAGNEMVEKTYQAKKVMKLMGSGYKKIHVCINNCLLYWKDDKDLTACRTCRISRWKVDNKTHKVYENIPAKAWRTIDEKFPEIAEDPRNLRLGISADGFDVNRGNRHHSVWPILTVIYNLPPWLCMKRSLSCFRY
ncbi:putative reverse transcriptase domain-containing protein [Tanacetum coccineum]